MDLQIARLWCFVLAGSWAVWLRYRVTMTPLPRARGAGLVVLVVSGVIGGPGYLISHSHLCTAASLFGLLLSLLLVARGSLPERRRLN